MTAAKKQKPKAKKPKVVVPIQELLRWTLEITSAFVNLSPNKVVDQMKRGLFPPRVAVDGKEQFVPDEVRAWAAGRDWRSMVAARLATEGAARES